MKTCGKEHKNSTITNSQRDLKELKEGNNAAFLHYEARTVKQETFTVHFRTVGITSRTGQHNNLSFKPSQCHWINHFIYCLEIFKVIHVLFMN